jgi:hypothetical protein
MNSLEQYLGNIEIERIILSERDCIDNLKVKKCGEITYIYQEGDSYDA